MHKLSHLVGSKWLEHSFSPIFTQTDQQISGGIPKGNAAVFENLVACLSEPIFLLYVLHTPRGEAAAGRYQSPELTLAVFRAFIEKYKDFLAGDARFDIWAHSPHDNATVVWDRHNKFFAYGPLQTFSSALNALGFSEGTPIALGEHQHHYRKEFDSAAKAVITEYQWSYSSLLPEDEQ